MQTLIWVEKVSVFYPMKYDAPLFAQVLANKGSGRTGMEEEFKPQTRTHAELV
jgi:hypothetical protein